MEEKWTTVIKAKKNPFELNFKEVWKYRDLLFLFVKRGFTAKFKQTILGPAWSIIQPLLSTFVYTFIFGSIAGLAPGNTPQFLFYLSGTIVWTFFSNCVTATSSTFIANAGILSKVYFPRLVMPLSQILTQLVFFMIEMLLFLLAFALFFITPTLFGGQVYPNLYILLVPVLLIQAGVLAMGVGVIISSVTTKYRDLQMLVGFGLQIWMYATPVVYDIAMFQGKSWSWLYMLNPMTPIVQVFRYAFLGNGGFPLTSYLISLATTLVIFILGVFLFNKTEKNFIDTI